MLKFIHVYQPMPQHTLAARLSSFFLRRFRKDKVVIYDAEGNVLVSDKEGRT